ncbi:hypothetical protein GCM10023213_07170 [Prosthecobacter algae]|uniref:Uncharacterized protein n=1 Tax=Prosthecobacter algae TaxID=1144682 RepID=A0ABP9NVT8_9BACT
MLWRRLATTSARPCVSPLNWAGISGADVTIADAKTGDKKGGRRWAKWLLSCMAWFGPRGGGEQAGLLAESEGLAPNEPMNGGLLAVAVRSWFESIPGIIALNACSLRLLEGS